MILRIRTSSGVSKVTLQDQQIQSLNIKDFHELISSQCNIPINLLNQMSWDIQGNQLLESNPYAKLRDIQLKHGDMIYVVRRTDQVITDEKREVAELQPNNSDKVTEQKSNDVISVSSSRSDSHTNIFDKNSTEAEEYIRPADKVHKMRLYDIEPESQLNQNNYHLNPLNIDDEAYQIANFNGLFGNNLNQSLSQRVRQHKKNFVNNSLSYLKDTQSSKSRRDIGLSSGLGPMSVLRDYDSKGEVISPSINETINQLELQEAINRSKLESNILSKSRPFRNKHKKNQPDDIQGYSPTSAIDLSSSPEEKYMTTNINSKPTKFTKIDSNSHSSVEDDEIFARAIQESLNHY